MILCLAYNLLTWLPKWQGEWNLETMLILLGFDVIIWLLINFKKKS